MPKSGKTTTEEGYGAEHQRIRQAELPKAYGTLCHLCQQPMLPGQALDLDHSPDRTTYRGFTHSSCNRSDGARRGNAARRVKVNSRDW